MIDADMIYQDLLPYSNKTREFVMKIINAQPTVEPQSRPRGKWHDKTIKIKGAHGLAYGRYGCSTCKKKFPNKSNYCPNCGADMSEEVEE